jgi:hypothetical protein
VKNVGEGKVRCLGTFVTGVGVWERGIGWWRGRVDGGVRVGCGIRVGRGKMGELLSVSG